MPKVCKRVALVNVWGEGRGLGQIKDWPNIPRELSTVRAGKRAERWRERMRILILQRDIQTYRFAHAIEARMTNQKLADSIRRLNRLIDACSKRIGDLRDEDTITLAHQND